MVACRQSAPTEAKIFISKQQKTQNLLVPTCPSPVNTHGPPESRTHSLCWSAKVQEVRGCLSLFYTRSWSHVGLDCLHGVVWSISVLISHPPTHPTTSRFLLRVIVVTGAEEKLYEGSLSSQRLHLPALHSYFCTTARWVPDPKSRFNAVCTPSLTLHSSSERRTCRKDSKPWEIELGVFWSCFTGAAVWAQKTKQYSADRIKRVKLNLVLL